MQCQNKKSFMLQFLEWAIITASLEYMVAASLGENNRFLNEFSLPLREILPENFF